MIALSLVIADGKLNAVRQNCGHSLLFGSWLIIAMLRNFECSIYLGDEVGA